MLKVDIHNVEYQERCILDSIQMTIEEGQVTGISGQVGTGKTTLLNIIAGIIPNAINASFEGKVTYKGRDILNNEVDYVFQHSENSLFYDTVARQLRHLKRELMQEWLDRFGILDCYSKATSDLSVGQKKIVTLVASLLSDAPVCLLDEPSAHLDDKVIEVFLELVECVKENKVILIASHDSKLLKYCNRRFHIEEGIIKEIKAEPDIFLPQPESKELSKSDPLVLVRQLHYEYPDGTKCFNGLNITIYKERIIGLIGGNGAGKSTLSNLIIEAAKQKKPKRDAIKLIGKPRCSILFQDFYKQFFTFSVEDELMFGLPKNRKNRELVQGILEEIGLWELREQLPQFLSDGQKRLLLVSGFLLRNIDLLILDEPFDCLDTKSIIIMQKLIEKYQQIWQNTIIINEQNEKYLTGLAHEIIYLT